MNVHNIMWKKKHSVKTWLQDNQLSLGMWYGVIWQRGTGISEASNMSIIG
jgi:hypothetical protein